MVRKCSAVRPAVTTTTIHDYSFTKMLPISIHEPIKNAVTLTSTTGKEQSITFCRLRNTSKIYVSDHVIGHSDETIIKPCNPDSEQIGDLHTHPTENNTTVGITPSTSDMVSTLVDSVNHNIPQISCITGPNAKYIDCYQPHPKVMKNKEKVVQYKKTLEYNDSKVTDVPSYIRDNVAHDFVHAWYDKNTFRRTVPNPIDVVHDAFTLSAPYLKFEDVPEKSKKKFCNMIEDLNYPMKGKVSKACFRYLKIK